MLRGRYHAVGKDVFCHPWLVISGGLVIAVGMNNEKSLVLEASISGAHHCCIIFIADMLRQADCRHSVIQPFRLAIIAFYYLDLEPLGKLPRIFDLLARNVCLLYTSDAADE